MPWHEKAPQAADSKANCETSGIPKELWSPAPNKQISAILLRVKANDVAAESTCNSDSTHYSGTVALCSTILWTGVPMQDAAMLSVIESAETKSTPRFPGANLETPRKHTLRLPHVRGLTGSRREPYAKVWQKRQILILRSCSVVARLLRVQMTHSRLPRKPRVGYSCMNVRGSILIYLYVLLGR